MFHNRIRYTIHITILYWLNYTEDRYRKNNKIFNIYNDIKRLNYNIGIYIFIYTRILNASY